MPGYGLTCTVSGIDHLLVDHDTMVEDKNRKNDIVKTDGIVDEPSAGHFHIPSNGRESTFVNFRFLTWAFL